MNKYLTTSQKDRAKPFLTKKQEGKCLFCKDPLTFVTSPNDPLHTTTEHLDGNVFNNKIENLALAHKRCNNDKKHNADYQIIAKAQLEENHNSFDSLSESASKAPKGREASIEIDVNKAYAQLTKEYLNARLKTENKPAINKKDACRSIAYLMFEKISQGSPYTAQRHIEMFTSSVGPYEEIEEGGETLIIRKKSTTEKHLNVFADP